LDKKPHLIIFNPDQWRGDVLGHLGNAAALTPNIDRIITRDAISFSRAFVQNPVCTPSRCSFMSGWYPHVRGHRTMFHMLRKDEPMLLKRLKQEGYFVWWGGKNDVVPGQDGYEEFCDIKHPGPDRTQRPVFENLHSSQDWRGQPESDSFYSFYYGEIKKPEGFPESEEFVYSDDWHHVLGAVDLIKSWNKERPLCIYLPLHYPHPPYAVEDPWYSEIDRQKLPRRIPTPENWSGKPSILKGIHDRQNMHTWTEERWTELRATYYGMCARVDHQFGMIVQALEDADLYNDTAVFFFADHGDFTGDYGLVEKTQNTFEDCLVRVPFIFKPPAWIKTKPGVRDTLVELIDFPATVEDLLSIEPDHTHFGRSLLHLVTGNTTTHRDAVFCEGGRIHGEQQAMELFREGIDQHFLYWPRLCLQQQEGPEHTKAVMCRTQNYKYVRRLYEMDELYDLILDPDEEVNRIADPSYRDVLLNLKERLLDFYLETGDVVPLDVDRRW
jgi:arylsulfatase A-like enzyme